LIVKTFHLDYMLDVLMYAFISTLTLYSFQWYRHSMVNLIVTWTVRQRLGI